MLVRTFWQLVVRDRADFLPRLLRALSDSRARYCVIGGVAVNAYAEPHITLDFDLVMAADDLPALERALAGGFDLERSAHTTNVTSPESGLRVQISTDARYAGIIERAEWRTVLGFDMRVAALPDVLQGKIWAAESSRPPPTEAAEGPVRHRAAARGAPGAPRAGARRDPWDAAGTSLYLISAAADPSLSAT